MWVASKHRTPKYNAAIAALSELAEESPDMIGRAFAEVDSEITKDWVTEGLRRSSGSQSHLRLVGKRARWPVQELPFFADHTDLWLKNGRPFLWTTQPYSLNNPGIKELADLMTDLDLNATITANRSWHFPGSTIMIELTKEDPEE